MGRYCKLIIAALAISCTADAPQRSFAGTDDASGRLEVEIVVDEAAAVLDILAARAAGREPTESEWQRLFETEGYRRLQQRERSLGRSFEDADFQAFVMSDTLLSRADVLRRTLDSWRTIDPEAAARRAFAYLPAHAVVRARIYPVIKPLPNSFVFETRTAPAIFLFLDPSLSSAQFENTLAHELHHIGFASACDGVARDSTLAPGARAALDWMGAFAEGRAMLAAAGAADANPHSASDPGDRAVWERDLARAHEDVRRLEEFFHDLIAGRLSDDEATRRGFTFFSTDSTPQGAFYTIGWLMSSTIEEEFGRDRLVASICDPRMFITDYQRSALQRNRRGESLPLWSNSLLRRVGADIGGSDQ